MMIKLKTILTEGFAWERKEGKGLPTMAEVKAEYDAKQLKENDSYEAMSDSQLMAAAEEKGMEEIFIMDSDGLANRDEVIDLLNAEDSDMQESAKPDFLDLDGDGNEKESMKSAAADSTDYGNYINKARAKSHLATNAGMVYGIDGSGKGHPITNASEIEKYSKWTIKSESMNEGFVSRLKKNLIGAELRK